MTNQEIANALDAIEMEYQNDIRETEKRVNQLKEELSHISDLSAKYEANNFTPEEAAIVDEYENLKGDWRIQCLQRKDDKIRALKARIENDIRTRRPKELISSNTKVSNEIFKKDNEPFYNASVLLAVENQKRRKGKAAAKPISVSVSLQYNPEQDPNIKLVGKRLNNFDRIVHDAVVTQFVDGGNRYITTDMIAYVINGGKDINNAPKLREAINESIDKLFYTSVIIDAKEQAKSYGLDDGGFRGRLLDFDLIWGIVNGQKIQCMDFSEKIPVLYRYADKLGQVIRSDLNMLNIPGLQNYPENIELKNYLLHRLEIDDSSKTRVIRYDAIYNLLNVTADNPGTLRAKKRDIRQNVKKCLDYWISTGKILGYEEIKEGKEIAKIEIKIGRQKIE